MTDKVRDPNAEYHALGRADDPRNAVLSASQLVAGFNPNDPSAVPLKTLATITDPPWDGTFDSWAGTLLHALLLDGLESIIEPDPIKYTAKLGKSEKECEIEIAVCRLGPYLIPPAKVSDGGTLVGIEQRRRLRDLADELGLQLVAPPAGKNDTPSITLGAKAWQEARALAEWLGATPTEECRPCGGTGIKCEECSTLSVSAQRARYLLCEAPGVNEQVYRGQWGDIETRAKPDRVLEDGSLINLKRTAFAHPSQFWRVADQRGWWAQEAFYEAAMPEGWVDGEPWKEFKQRPWVIVAIAPPTKRNPAQAFCYPCPENRQAKARQDLADMMDRYAQCLETGRWESFPETLAEQPAPGGLYDWRVDYETYEESMMTEGDTDDDGGIPWT